MLTCRCAGSGFRWKVVSDEMATGGRTLVFLLVLVADALDAAVQERVLAQIRCDLSWPSTYVAMYKFCLRCRTYIFAGGWHEVTM